MKSMMSGTVPSVDDFSEAWDKTWTNEDRDPSEAMYRIRNDKTGFDGDYNENELYKLIEHVCQSGSEDELNTISAILSTLGIEWV